MFLLLKSMYMKLCSILSVGAVLETNSGETEIVARLLTDKDKVGFLYIKK